MLLILKAPQSDVVAMLQRADTSASVGPTSPREWTASWIESSGAPFHELLAEGPFLLIKGKYLRTTLTVRNTAGDLQKLTWPHVRRPAAAEAVASTLVDMFSTSHDLDRVTQVLNSWRATTESLAEQLGQALALPELVEQIPDRLIVVTTCTAADGRTALGDVEGGWLDASQAGWLGLLPENVSQGQGEVVASAASLAGGKSTRTLSLSRHSGGITVEQWVDGYIEDDWSSRWVNHTLSDTEPGATTVDLAVLLRGVGSGANDEVGAMTELADRLEIPARFLSALGARADHTTWPHAVRVASSSAAKRFVIHSLAPTTSRRWRAISALASAFGAVACLLMAAIGWAVVATDGAFVDEPSSTADDWYLAIVFSALTIGLLTMAVLRLGQWRASRARRP